MKIKNGLLLVALMISAQHVMATESRHEAEIKAVIEQFRTSIINKDKAVFSSLFFSDDIPFIAVFSKEMLAAKRAVKADYPSVVDFGKFGPPEKMIADTGEQEEKIWNIDITTDGYLASVHFNYSDHENGKQKAFGTESWSMVKVDDNWKITSVSFVVTEIEHNDNK